MKSKESYFSKFLLTAFCLLTIAYNNCSYADGVKITQDEDTGAFSIEASPQQTLKSEKTETKDIISTLSSSSACSLRLMFVSFESPFLFNEFLEALNKCRMLIELRLDGIRINCDAIDKICKVLQNCSKSLKSLGLCLTDINQESMVVILNTLQGIQLEEIYLDGINEKNAANLLAILSTTTTLHRLELNCNNISDELAEGIVNYLSRNTTLISFKLILAWNGRISLASTQRIIHAVENNPRLRETADLWLPSPIHLQPMEPQVQPQVQPPAPASYFSALIACCCWH